MVLRLAKKGSFAGKHFFGCPKFPNCRETVNYDPAIHGPIEEVKKSSRKTKSSSQSKSLLLEFPSPRKRETPKSPIHFESRSKFEDLQSRFYENALLPEQLLKSLHRGQIDSSLLRSLSQWRLDYPFPVSKIDSVVHQSILGVVEKILLRGSRTLCSPNVQAVLNDRIYQTQLAQDDWVKVAREASYFRSGSRGFDWFDSDEEKEFYLKVLPDSAGSINVQQWIIPQVSLNSLLPGSIEAGGNQRVDFLLTHPVGLKMVIEIDGQQHQESVESDQRRDEKLSKHGFKVVRIPVDEIRAGGGKNLDSLEIIFSAINWEKDSPDNNSLILGILLSRAAGQIQASMLQALKSGFLPLSQEEQWNINCEKPKWCGDEDLWKDVVDAAIDDFIGLLEAINKLYLKTKLDIQCSSISSKNNQSGKITPHIQLVFTDNAEQKDKANCFYVADIYVPNPIAQSLPVVTENPVAFSDKDTIEYLLYYIFRKDSFMDGQWDAIQRSIDGMDSIVLLPTGGGKSIAFQLASLLRPGPCIVIDPLIALINDQIDNLRSMGIDRVIGITSQLSQEEKIDALKAFSRGHYLFCYVAPERLQMEDFREALRAVTTISPISVIAIDEAHCVSEWGHDFRTSYLNVARNARKFCEHKGRVPPLLGLTGTASRSVLKDLQRELDIEDFDAVITPKSFDRPELGFQVVHCSSSEKNARLKGFLGSLPELFGVSHNTFFQPRGSDSMAGLIFFPHVNGEFGVSTGYQELRQIVSDSGLYSGSAPKGIDKDQWNDLKSAFAERFKHDELTLLICTNAYGMGIDKPNIRYTVHTNLPRSIEAFYQEAGRAGRDRKNSVCLLIVSNDNPARTNKLLDPTTPLSEIARITKEVGWGESDDIVRMMFFHVNAFKGAQEEVQSVRNLIRELGDLRQMRSETISYTRDTRQEREKAVHRLVILSVIDDYTTDYSHEEIKVRLSGADKETILEGYIKYVSAYNRRLAANLEDLAREKLHLEYSDFLDFILQQLINFLYNTVELGRRRSLAEMLQASSSGNSGEDIRQHILNYLELGEYSDLLEKAMDRADDLPLVIEEIIADIATPNDAAEIRGQTARLLESYPDNPALLFVRSLSEILCRDCDEQIALDNLNAGIQFAQSLSGWALSSEDITQTAIVILKRVKDSNLDLGDKIINLILEKSSCPRMSARMFLSNSDLEFPMPAVNYLMEQIIAINEKILI